MNTDPRMTGLAGEVTATVHAGARALRDGDPLRAEMLLQQACQQAPTHPEPWRYLAIVQLQTRRAALARTTLQHALSLAAEDAQLHSDLGNAQSACGDLAAAMASWQHATTLDPALPMPWFNLGRNHQQLGHTQAAITALTCGVALAPQALPPRILLADALAHAGQFEQASQHYRHALQQQPACGDAWRGLSNIKTTPLSAADSATLHQQLQRVDVAPSDKVAMGHALGKLEEDHGHYARAFDAFSAANALQQRLTPWSAQAFLRFLDHVLTATATLPPPLDPALGKEVIFIVGLPRSGSTLFEQILAAHPMVEGASELPDLGEVLQQESQRRGQPYPQWVPQASAEDWHRLGQAYLQRTARWRAHHMRMTDKQPDNWKHAGILRAMLPNATVIETRRDPLETGWSCFKQQFYSQPHFANDLTHIATYLQGCERAMDAWRERAPTRLYLHRYEALLQTPEASIRRLLQHCDLTFDPACLAFHQHPRNVRTASAAQVRQPLRTTAPLATAYGELLQPLRQALLQPPISI